VSPTADSAPVKAAKKNSGNRIGGSAFAGFYTSLRML
jgi:hypothetical protein